MSAVPSALGNGSTWQCKVSLSVSAIVETELPAAAETDVSLYIVKPRECTGGHRCTSLVFFSEVKGVPVGIIDTKIPTI